MIKWFQGFTSPPAYFQAAGTLGAWLLWLSLPLLAYGLVGGLVLAPSDYQQGDAFRIIYVHVPSAWMSLFGYTVMAIFAIVALIWRLKVAECIALACAPVGASFTALALVTGMLWGKPMWGTYWLWQDARLVSELILLFLYLGIIALSQAMANPRAGARAASLLIVVGWINVPIVHYSVEWWNTLHQTSTVARLGKPSMNPQMLWPLLSMALGYTLFSAAVVLQRSRHMLRWRERGNPWAREAQDAPHDTNTGARA